MDRSIICDSSEYLAFGSIPVNCDGRVVFTENFNYTHKVKRVVEIMKDLVESNEIVFFVVREGRRRRVAKTRLGERLLSCFDYDLKEIGERFSTHRYSPLFSLYKRYLAPFGNFRKGIYFEDVVAINEAIAKVRRFARGSAIGRKLDNLRRAERKIARSSREFLQELRVRYSKLLVVRIDLGYYSEFCPKNLLRGMEVSLEDVRGHKSKFLDYLRKGPYSKHLAGYMWKLEYGLEKGYHIHMAVFFDGQHLLRDINIADALGGYWASCVTDGKGVFFNCNKMKADYARCGIGLIARKDDEKWLALKDAIRYLTKVDLFIKFRPNAPARTFGVGGPYGGVSSKQLPNFDEGDKSGLPSTA